MNSRISAGAALGFCLMAGLSACTEEDYKLYDTAQKDSVFFEYRDTNGDLIDKVDYQFNYDIATVHTVEVPVTLMGVPKDYDRTIDIVTMTVENDDDEAADEETPVLKQMVEGVNYTITDNIIRAGAVSGVVRINLLRDRDPEILSEAKTVTFTIGENDDLKSVGDNKITINYSDIRPDIRPEWWTTYSPMPVYSFENAQLFFQYFYEYAPKADINLYNDMIQRYGDYFVHAQFVQGPLAMFSNYIRNFVLIPLYRDHPEIGWQSSPEW